MCGVSELNNLDKRAEWVRTMQFTALNTKAVISKWCEFQNKVGSIFTAALWIPPSARNKRKPSDFIRRSRRKLTWKRWRWFLAEHSSFKFQRINQLIEVKLKGLEMSKGKADTLRDRCLATWIHLLIISSSTYMDMKNTHSTSLWRTSRIILIECGDAIYRWSHLRFRGSECNIGESLNENKTTRWPDNSLQSGSVITMVINRPNWGWELKLQPVSAKIPLFPFFSLIRFLMNAFDRRTTDIFEMHFVSTECFPLISDCYLPTRRKLLSVEKVA